MHSKIISKNEIVIVSGMSGAGKSVALKTLEDVGFEAMDNIPLSLMLLTIDNNPEGNDLVIGVDIRNRDFFEQDFMHKINALRANKSLKCTLMFLDCEDEELRKRFTANRRKHPISKDVLITDSIGHERDLLTPLKEGADMIIDTTNLSNLDLQKYLRANFGKGSKDLLISLISFSFRKGVPKESDLVFDMRFLKNPFYDQNLRSYNGTDIQIKEFFDKDKIFAEFSQNLANLILPLLPLYHQEGKNYLTISFGCTGGIHRSVYGAINLQKILSSKGYMSDLRHRELDEKS